MKNPPIVSTNFLIWRFFAWFNYSIIAIVIMIACSIANIPDHISAFSGVIICSFMGAFNIFEPKVIHQEMEELRQKLKIYEDREDDSH